MTSVTEEKPNPLTCLSADWVPFAQKLATALEKLEEHQFLILPVKRSRRYIQFSAQGAFGMRVETTSNSYLNKKEQLNEQQISFLIDVGWQAPTNTPNDSTPEKDPDGSPNYFVSFPAPISFTEVANLTVRTFAEVLCVPHPGRLQYFAFDKEAGNFELPELGLKLENQKLKPVKEKDIPQQLLGAIRETTGITVNPIQARKALEEFSSWRSTEILEIGDGFITLKIDDITTRFHCADTKRLQGIYTSGRVPLSKNNTPLVLIANYNVLIIPCADEGAILSNHVPINSNVVYFEDGAALFSPTENGAWHLFSIG